MTRLAAFRTLCVAPRLRVVGTSSYTRYASLVKTRLYTVDTNAKEGQGERELVYQAEVGEAAKYLKLMSVSSFAIAGVASPFIVIFRDNPALVEANVNLSVLGASLLASGLSTFLIHKFFSPFVTKIYLHKSHSTFANEESEHLITPFTKITLETLSLLGMPRYTTLQLRDLLPGDKNLETWIVKSGVNTGKGPKTFWLERRQHKEEVKKMIQVVKDWQSSQGTGGRSV
ncbi:hypothetical protein K493DRAFT_320833 [Basidiobolus meristosporus CBS 931.73]|uniref:Uncharacterized protein n=1 Tax=Basidiobolus meristosporus CBS 931.73 TaxID=1314790 RepID=A0A1Y1X5V4_9FUNG|nr:hypothetical protein K493DRAFT_320833 [Basidiobolus meristosporus CBS 931.73]|eukprot:ORX80746.1 hypothetical protein K493DRAFT_320833 [Basidiobolus meristosporus CBS 931.73]